MVQSVGRVGHHPFDAVRLLPMGLLQVYGLCQQASNVDELRSNIEREIAAVLPIYA